MKPLNANALNEQRFCIEQESSRRTRHLDRYRNELLTFYIRLSMSEHKESAFDEAGNSHFEIPNRRNTRECLLTWFSLNSTP